MLLDIILDCLLDSLKMLPLIFLTYIIIELIERKADFAKNGRFLTGKAAPVLGSLAGAFPQCGISVMSAKLYERGIIGVGTLLSVFIATSDEAFSILISSPQRLSLIPLLLIKIVIAITVGEIANLIFHKKTVIEDEKFDHEEICAHCHDHGTEEDDHDDDHQDEHFHAEKLRIRRYLFVPFMHSLQTFAYVLAVTLVFGILFADNGLIGADKLSAFLDSSKYFAPFITSLIGLIPNCASSAVITSAYVRGAISFGAMTAGLISNAGVGLAILFKNTQKTKRNLILTLTLYLIGSICGIIISSLEYLFPA